MKNGYQKLIYLAFGLLAVVAICTFLISRAAQ